MAKSFESLKRNKNTGTSLDKVIRQVGEVEKTSEDKEKFRKFTFKIPKDWHDKMKFDLSRTQKKSIQDLIIDALKNTYSELK